MDYQVTIRISENLAEKARQIMDMGEFASRAVIEALEREVGQKDEAQREAAFQAVLNLKVSQGTNPKSTTEILREIRDSSEH